MLDDNYINLDKLLQLFEPEFSLEIVLYYLTLRILKSELIYWTYYSFVNFKKHVKTELLNFLELMWVLRLLRDLIRKTLLDP